jgi:hypothetical protein
LGPNPKGQAAKDFNRSAHVQIRKDGAVNYFLSVYFVIGVLVVVVYAWQQFNKPSIQYQATLPRTVDPLRYLFLKSAYKRAHYTYVTVSIVLYCIFVSAGPEIGPWLFREAGDQEIIAKTWPLVIALAVVGVVPNQKVLMSLEDAVRRAVHAWFLVPDGIVKTVAVLEDTDYDPPQNQLDAVTNPERRNKISKGLKLPVITLQYRWARATMLMVSLQQMRPPLSRSAFDPFDEDFEEIRTSYRAIARSTSSRKTPPMLTPRPILFG